MLVHHAPISPKHFVTISKSKVSYGFIQNYWYYELFFGILTSIFTDKTLTS